MLKIDDKETVQRIICLSLEKGGDVLKDQRTKEFVKRVLEEKRNALLYFSGLRALGYKHSEGKDVFSLCLLEGPFQIYRVNCGWDWNGNQNWENIVEKFSCFASFQQIQGPLFKLQKHFGSS